MKPLFVAVPKSVMMTRLGLLKNSVVALSNEVWFSVSSNAAIRLMLSLTIATSVMMAVPLVSVPPPVLGENGASPEPTP